MRSPEDLIHARIMVTRVQRTAQPLNKQPLEELLRLSLYNS
jgi:hypothetical protein